MKKYKIIIWIFVLYICQNIIIPMFSRSGLVPDLVMGFAVSYASLDIAYKKISPVVIISAVVAAVGCGRVFPIAVIFVGFAAVAVYLSKNYLRFIPQFLRTLAVTSVFAFVMCVAENFAFGTAVTLEFVKNTAVWYTFLTAFGVCVIYPFVKRATAKNTDNSLLITERN